MNSTIFDARKPGKEGFERERRRLRTTRDIMTAYYILFDSAVDAKRFIALRRNSIEKLGPQMIEKFKITQNVCRKANFVGIFLANEEGLRINFAQASYEFDEDEMNL